MMWFERTNKDYFNIAAGLRTAGKDNTMHQF